MSSTSTTTMSLMSTTNIIIIIQHALTSLVGIVGNVLVLVVYKKKLRDKETITFFIVHLAITDLACCLFLIPLNCYHELYIGHFTSDFLCKFHSFLNIVNITYSCLLMTLVAIERCFSIMMPFRRIVTKTRAKWVMAALFSFCFAIALTSCLGIGIYHRVHWVRVNGLPNMDSVSSLQSALAANAYHYAHNQSDSIKSEDFSTTTTSYVEKMISNSMQKRHAEIFSSEYAFDYSNSTRLKRELTFVNVTEWMKTPNCFPNDRLIPMQYISYLRLFQNLIVVGCFATIFILYALICARVTQRRQLKADRDHYYKELLDRSKRNTMITVTPAPAADEKANKNLLTLSSAMTAVAEDYDQAVELKEKETAAVSGVVVLQLRTDVSDPMLSQATVMSSNSNNNLAINNIDAASYQTAASGDNLEGAAVGVEDQETCLDLFVDNDNNKSTQTVKSSISYIKNSHSNSLASSKLSPEHHKYKKRSISYSSSTNPSRKLHHGHYQKARNSHVSRHPSKKHSAWSSSQASSSGGGDALTFSSSQSRYSTVLLANLKTAFMLFVVTLIMAIVFTPSLLTSLHVIDYNPIHWNIIYINNAANPIVYSFLNYNFRKNLKNTFKYCYNRLFSTSNRLEMK